LSYQVVAAFPPSPHPVTGMPLQLFAPSIQQLTYQQPPQPSNAYLYQQLYSILAQGNVSTSVPSHQSSLAQPSVTATAANGNPCLMTTAAAATTKTSTPTASSSSSRVLAGRPPVPLSLDLDSMALSPYQCELRKHIELFETQPDDIKSGVQGRNVPIKVGQGERNEGKE
jgi:hypothetical protein